MNLKIKTAEIKFELYEDEYIFYNDQQEKIFLTNKTASLLYKLIVAEMTIDELVDDFIKLFDDAPDYNNVYNDVLLTIFQFALSKIVILELDGEKLYFNDDSEINPYLDKLYKNV